MGIAPTDLTALRAAASSLDQAATIATDELARIMEPRLGGFHPIRDGRLAAAARGERVASMEQVRSHAAQAVVALDGASQTPAVATARLAAQELIDGVDHGIPRVQHPDSGGWWRYESVPVDAGRSLQSVRALVDALAAEDVGTALAKVADGPVLGAHELRRDALLRSVAATREGGLGVVGDLATVRRRPSSDIRASGPEFDWSLNGIGRMHAVDAALDAASGGEATAIRAAFPSALRSISDRHVDPVRAIGGGEVVAARSADPNAYSVATIRGMFDRVAADAGNTGRTPPAWFDGLDPQMPLRIGPVEAAELHLLAVARNAEHAGDIVGRLLVSTDRSRVAVSASSVDRGGLTMHVTDIGPVPHVDRDLASFAVASQRLPAELRPSLPPWATAELEHRIGASLA